MNSEKSIRISKKEEIENKFVFEDYLEELDLTLEDLKGKILDIGSASAGFAKWAKDHGINSEIYSIDSFPETEFREKDKASVAEAKTLPFRDGVFGIVLMNHVGFSDSWPENHDEMRKQIKDDVSSTFSEVIRVLRQGGELRFQFDDAKYTNDPNNRTNIYIDIMNDELSDLERKKYDISYIYKTLIRNVGKKGFLIESGL